MTREEAAGPLLDPESESALRKGVAEFNCGKFFECHDTLEEIWRGTRGPARDFLQGLIQISVGFYHLRNGNNAGGESQLSKGLKNIECYGNAYAGIELARLRQEVETWLGKVRRGEKLEAALDDLPKFNFVR